MTHCVIAQKGGGASSWRRDYASVTFQRRGWPVVANPPAYDRWCSYWLCCGAFCLCLSIGVVVMMSVGTF